MDIDRQTWQSCSDSCGQIFQFVELILCHNRDAYEIIFLSFQMLCQWIFSQWAIKELFIDENDSVREWWFRSWLDRYVSKTSILVVLW